MKFIKWSFNFSPAGWGRKCLEIGEGWYIRADRSASSKDYETQRCCWGRLQIPGNYSTLNFTENGESWSTLPKGGGGLRNKVRIKKWTYRNQKHPALPSAPSRRAGRSVNAFNQQYRSPVQTWPIQTIQRYQRGEGGLSIGRVYSANNMILDCR